MAEFERSLIQERVKAGIAHARSKGKRLGRPAITVDSARIAELRATGASWPMIAREMGILSGKHTRSARAFHKFYLPVPL